MIDIKGPHVFVSWVLRSSLHAHWSKAATLFLYLLASETSPPSHTAGVGFYIHVYISESR